MNVTDFQSFIDFIRDPSQVEEQLVALKAENDRRDAQISVVGAIADINSLQAQADTDRQNAADLLAQAKVDAAALIDNARTSYDARFASLNQREVDLNVQAQNAQDLLNQAQQLNKDLNAELQNQINNYRLLNQQLQDARDEVATRLEKLKSVMG